MVFVGPQQIVGDLGASVEKAGLGRPLVSHLVGQDVEGLEEAELSGVTEKGPWRRRATAAMSIQPLRRASLPKAFGAAAPTGLPMPRTAFRPKR